jgi:uncharacterized protein YndB with AHSA1/START domain
LKNTRPPLVISRLAGDAVISYGLRDHFLQSQSFIEMIENTYVSFRREIEQMVMNNQCHCNACSNINTLDLKFFVHFGTFAIQHITDHDELVGSDVNLIHRLLKNHVTERTGYIAYLLFTNQAIQQLGLEMDQTTLIPLVESYAYLGDVKVWIQDMHPVWQKKQSIFQITIPPEQLNFQLSYDFHVPPEILWGYLVQPEFRNYLMGSDKQEIVDRKNGRIEAGSSYHCYHGNHVISQVILDWEPFSRMVTQNNTQVPNTTILMEFQLTPTQDGTHVTVNFSKAKGSFFGRKAVDVVMPRMKDQLMDSIRNFNQAIEADQQSLQGLEMVSVKLTRQDLFSAVKGCERWKANDEPFEGKVLGKS